MKKMVWLGLAVGLILFLSAWTASKSIEQPVQQGENYKVKYEQLFEKYETTMEKYASTMDSIKAKSAAARKDIEAANQKISAYEAAIENVSRNVEKLGALTEQYKQNGERCDSLNKVLEKENKFLKAR